MSSGGDNIRPLPGRGALTPGAQRPRPRRGEDGADIRSMFVKLGVSSRAEVARAVERADQEAGSP